MYKVLISAPYMLSVISRFEPILRSQGVDLVLAEVEERLDERDLSRYAGEVDGTICGDDRYSASVLQGFAPRLKVISKWGTGIDSIDLSEAESLGIKVFNTPGAFTEAVADSVMAYLLAFARNLIWIDREMKAGKWQKIPGHALHEKVLGVVGVGRIGKAVMRRAKAFGMVLLGNDIVEIDSSFVEEVGVTMSSLETLLSRSDYISLNCDLNPTSHHLINAQRIKLVQAESVLINTSRGSVIDEVALVRALEREELRGAALDVFEEEPIDDDNPLLKMDQVILAPHNANSSPAAWERVHWNSIRNLFIGLGLEVPDEVSEAASFQGEDGNA